MTIPVTNSHFLELPETAEEAKHYLVLASRILALEGVCDAYGHVSVRNPESPSHFFVPESISPELVTVDDIMEMDFQDRVLNGRKELKMGESVIHASIYKARSDVNCVCHMHPAELVAFASTDIPLRSIYHQDITSGDGVPVFRDLPEECGMLINDLSIADRLAAQLGDGRGILIRNHGAVTVGESVARAVYSLVMMRDNARISFMAASLGGQVNYISPGELAFDLRNQFNSRCIARAWKYWIRRAQSEFPEIRALCVGF